MKKWFAVIAILVIALCALAQEKKNPLDGIKIASIEMVPSYSVPASTCKAGEKSGGWLIISSQDHKPKAAFCAGGCTDDMKPNSAQVGQYVEEMIDKGYTLTLTPQGDGWMFVNYKCEPGK